ncbi:hypothetical protein I350_08207 [Cryptococcus amylolentus CBS 6273]|uniref:MHD domain-containing protein n=1 Tax=Cryptococcus amylolentus CBS 6273 TaxID=1296118 RepID=A0A1E3J8P5_9TREE|nr:hypothetical protein I350_08207 [Cryptococcus amylolentus CBS 6273]
MSDSLPDDIWVQSFLPTPPRALLTALQKRHNTSNVHLAALADIFKQRALIEAQYADSLAKLAKSADSGLLTGKIGNDWAKNSGEARVWDSLVAELAETSASHSTLSALIRTDFEGPLRDLPGNIIPWRRINEQEASLDKTLKDYEKVSAKLGKASSKSKSSKVDGLQSELNQITQSLSSLSPMVYTTYQRLDEERLRAEKEIAVRWATVKGDMATRDGQRAEGTVASLLGWETGEEVTAVGQKLGAIGGGTAGSIRATPGPESVVGTPQSNRRHSSIAPSTRSHDFSPHPQALRNGSQSNLSTTGSSFAGGFKSMLGRTKTMGGSGNRNRSGSNATSTRSAHRTNDFEAIGEESRNHPLPSEPISAPSNAPPVDEEGFSVAPSDRHRNPWENPNELIPSPTGGSTSASHPTSPTGNNALFSQNFTSSPNASSENLDSATGQPRLNLSLAEKPIQESEEARQAALAKMQQTLQLPPPGGAPNRRSTIARRGRDVRNTMFGGPTDDGSQGFGFGPGTVVGASAGAATLPKLSEPEERLAESPASTRSNTFNRDTIPSPSPMGRRTSLSSVSSNNPFDSPGMVTSGMSGMTPQVATTSTDHPGLRANISEMVNVIFKSKTVSRIQITGEVHLSLRHDPAVTPTPEGPIHLRLTQFERLEKIAPNPAYLAQVPDRPGEYFLNAEVLAAATSKAPLGTGASKGTLLFKYVVHVQPGKEAAFLPLTLDPAFQCKEGETRMILHYTCSPSTSLSLQGANATIVAAFAPGPAITNVQAKPAGGVWSPATRRMQWKLDELDGEGKIIAKFTSESGSGEAMSPQGVQASWAVEGSLISGLGIEIVPGQLEGDGWKFEEVRQNTTTGKYLAEASGQ